MGLRIAIVESENDKYFIEAFIANRSIDIELESSTFCKIDDYECLEGDSLNKIKASIDAIGKRARKEDIEAIGIILDHDDKSEEKRIEQVDLAIKEVFPLAHEGFTIAPIGEIKELPLDDSLTVKVGLYLQNVDGRGNLETVLKEIKNKDSTHADCLMAWRECVEHHGLKIRDVDFDKFWISIYQRYDQCAKKERKQAGRKCDNKASMKKGIWDFNHPVLDDFYAFLKSM